MDFATLIRHRQSDRKYSDRPVEREKLLICIEAARLAPSADNSQPWKFIVADEPDVRSQVADGAMLMGMNKFVSGAPVMVAVVAEKSTVMSSLGGALNRKEFSLMDVGIAVSHFCLQAADIGLGTCIIGWFDEKKVKKALGIDSQKRVALLISVGYSESKTRQKSRKSIEEMSSWNRY
jgi:nitroreductase